MRVQHRFVSFLLTLIAAVALTGTSLAFQSNIPVQEIVVRTVPESGRLRPLDSLVIQVLAYGEIKDPDTDETRRVRLASDGAQFSLTGSNSGWLSKPFRFQGEEEEPFHTPEKAGITDILFGEAFGRLVVKDAVVYTAPLSGRRHVVKVSLAGHTRDIPLNVDLNAPSIRPTETTTFPDSSRDTSRYRALAEHHAPFIAQATWFDAKSDYIARFDFDGDWRGDNNWDQAPVGSSQAFVYYAAMETATHWFLVYDILHPRDYSDNCVAGTCHENDSEGLVLTILKDGTRFGRLQTMETLAHDNIYSYRADRNVKKNIHNIDGDIEFYQTHPIVFIESGGHGVYGSDDRRSLYRADRDSFRLGTGVTYVFKGKAERPDHPDARLVGYELLPAYEHLWLRGHHQRESHEALFDAYSRYSPFGRRPAGSVEPMAGAFLGRKFGSNKAKPFWAWKDRRTSKKKALSAGQWTIDPAYAVTRNLRFRERVSLDYLYNPYLEGDHLRAPVPPPAPSQGPVPPAPSPGNAPLPPPPPAGLPVSGSFAAVPVPNANNSERNGQFDIRLQVEGEVELLLREDRVAFRVVRGGNPQDLGSDYSQRMPTARYSNFSVRRQDGRGKVELLEKPVPTNGYLTRIRITDKDAGSDRYHVRIRWRLW